MFGNYTLDACGITSGGIGKASLPSYRRPEIPTSINPESSAQPNSSAEEAVKKPMLQKRSDEDILAMAPIKIQFGKTEYEVKLLSIGKAREWRKKLVEEVNTIMAELRMPAGSVDALSGGLAFAFLQFPEKMADLIFAYAVDLSRAKVEDEANDEQLSRAFGQIVQVAYPFASELGMLTKTLSLAQSFPTSGRSTN